MNKNFSHIPRSYEIIFIINNDFNHKYGITIFIYDEFFELKYIINRILLMLVRIKNMRGISAKNIRVINVIRGIHVNKNNDVYEL